MAPLLCPTRLPNCLPTGLLSAPSPCLPRFVQPGPHRVGALSGALPTQACAECWAFGTPLVFLLDATPAGVAHCPTSSLFPLAPVYLPPPPPAGPLYYWAYLCSAAQPVVCVCVSRLRDAGGSHLMARPCFGSLTCAWNCKLILVLVAWGCVVAFFSEKTRLTPCTSGWREGLHPSKSRLPNPRRRRRTVSYTAHTLLAHRAGLDSNPYNGKGRRAFQAHTAAASGLPPPPRHLRPAPPRSAPPRAPARRGSPCRPPRWEAPFQYLTSPVAHLRPALVTRGSPQTGCCSLALGPRD